MIRSRSAIAIPKTSVAAITTTDCFVRVSLSGQMILLNSAFKPLIKSFLGAFSLLAVSPIIHVLLKTGLLSFFVHCVSLAESAVLLGLHAVRMSFLILRHVVIALLAFCTCQCNLCAHDFHLRLILCKAAFFSACYRKLSIKKRPMFFHSPAHCNIESLYSQVFL